MDDKLFDELKQSLREARAIRAGTLSGRRTTVQALDVKALRESTRLSQGDFAAAINVSVRTLQNWEQQRREPTGPAIALLRVMAQAPDVVIKALLPVSS
ncbi:NadS family protein [Castellaniella ginsengisoli]|uniref:NadS family protein n=1 Tax=Castellaniella ginsengisoli TaxID=546114 RepID=A0AB39CZT0_9BURK